MNECDIISDKLATDKLAPNKLVTDKLATDKLVLERDTLGRVFTPPILVQELYALLGPLLRPGMRVYEPGVGDMRFHAAYPLTCTYSGCEISPVGDLPPTIYKGDFFDQPLSMYDLILGNPPFRIETSGPQTSPTPTKCPQVTIWPKIVKRCMEHLAEGGYLAMLLPCIWLKPDKEGIHELFMKHRILSIRCYSCTESNKLFGYKCQTPVSLVVLQKVPSVGSFLIYDNGYIPFTVIHPPCIPTQNAALLQASHRLIRTPLTCIKMSTVPKGNVIANPTKKFPLLTTFKEGMIHGLELDKPGPYHGIPKVLLLHKSQPVPFLDLHGSYGVGGRDVYVLPVDSYEMMSDPLVQKILKSFTIRMNYYEKQTFHYLPCVEEFYEWKKSISILYDP